MNRINEGRQFELDIARGLAVIFMIFIHVMIVFANESVYETTYGQAIDVLGGVPAAPVFMFLLGVGVIYSRKTDAKTCVKRGGLLILGGYILNVLRTVLPAVILALQDRTTSEFPFWQSIYYGLFNVDILQFAGIAFLFFAVVKYLKLDVKIIIFIGLIFILLNTFVPHENAVTASVITSPVTSLFVGGNEGLSYFPFLSWIVYPLSGYVFGYYLVQTQSKKHFYTRIGIVSGVIFFVYCIGAFFFTWPTGYESEAGYYFHNGLLNVVYGAFVLFWLSALYFISPIIKGAMREFLIKTSQYVSNIYFIHWVMIGFITLMIERESIHLLPLISLTCIIFIVSYYTSQRYVQMMRR